MPLDLSPAFSLLRREIGDLVGVYLFGSEAAGAARPESDVDLAVLAQRALPRPHLLDLRERLAAALMRDVDLVDLNDASTILQMQVIGEGRLVDAAQPGAAALFELRVMREYQDLKQRRAEIEADIVARGRVYAG